MDVRVKNKNRLSTNPWNIAFQALRKAVSLHPNMTEQVCDLDAAQRENYRFQRATGRWLPANLDFRWSRSFNIIPESVVRPGRVWQLAGGNPAWKGLTSHQ